MEKTKTNHTNTKAFIDVDRSKHVMYERERVR